ncbi:hypothetical protein K8I31_06490 [bacterium]|nr:hypothetical protein [bacterium]
MKEKNTNAAFTKALESLDILRAIWCLFFNPFTEWYSLLFGKQWVPINTIRLGGVHTIHDAKGKLCSEKVWYEPNFCKTTPYQPNQSGPLCNNIKWALESLNSSKYKSVIRDSMLRYVRALDERDQNVAIIRLWNALEILASPNEGNFDKISKRCSFLFTERNYHEQVIEHLREYRNRNVHSGDQDENSKNICYQIQYYYSQLILFHLRNASFFNCLEEANNYLDLPSNLDSLNKRKKIIEKAIMFVSPKDSK